MRCCLRSGARLVLAVFLPFVLLSFAAVSAVPKTTASVQSDIALSANSASAPTTLVGVACPDVMVIAARGTDEAPPNSEWQNPSAYVNDQYKGAGETLFTMYGQLKTVNPKLQISLLPVGYPTSLPSVKNGLRVLAEQSAEYLNDADIGADGIVEDVQATDIACGGTVRYVLAGYSLGAWAVHDALNQLAQQKKLGEIAGVALFGDPKFQPGQPYVRDFKSQDTYHGVAYYAIEQADNSIPPAVVPHTGSWCLPTDPICQFQYNHPFTWTRELGYCVRGKGACAHFQYPTDGETVNAAAFLTSFLPPSSLWPQLSGATPPDGTVGTPYTWTAAATPAGSYTWTFSGTLPPNLAFSTAGVLSGTPTQAGTYTFSITPTDPYGRTVTGPVTVTIDPGTTTGPPTWTPLKAPLPSDAPTQPSAELQSVACASASSCVAAGHYSGTGAGEGLLETLSSGTWTPATAPLPSDAASNPEVFLYSVACPAVAACVAVGGYTGTDGSPALIETLSGTTWTPTEAPLPSNAANSGAAFSSVACTSASVCIAVGGYSLSLTVGTGLLETLSGTTWTPMEAPVPSGDGAGTNLASVVCPSASACLAVGGYVDSSSDRQGLLEMLSGGSWTPVKAPLPSDAAANPNVYLTSAACASATSCTAAGYYSDTSGNIQGLLEILSGGTWTPVEAPLPANSAANPEVFLDSVACPSSSSCVATGNYLDASSHFQGLLEVLSGTSWTPVTAPLPTDASSNPDTQLLSVACAAASSCVAAGDYLNTPSTAHALLEFLSGTTWSSSEAPVPSAIDNTGSDLETVTCASSSSCVAVGGYWDSSQDHQALLITGPS